MGLPASSAKVAHLVSEHYVSLYRYAYRLSGNASDAEDLTQDAFCSAQRKWKQLRDPRRAKAWLFTIVRNGYLHRIRADKKHHFVPVEHLAEVADALPDPLPPIDPEHLQEALNELPEAFRTPVILYFFEDFSYRDIAEQMELPIGTVMSRLARAKGHLRARLLPSVEPVAHTPRRAPHGL
jgi:RNA polymerase sigma-70 factor (ECF subfamily)